MAETSRLTLSIMRCIMTKFRVVPLFLATFHGGCSHCGLANPLFDRCSPCPKLADYSVT